MRTLIAFLSILFMANVAVAEMTFIETSLPQGGTVLSLRQANPAALALPEAEFLAEFARANQMPNSDQAFRLIRPGNVKLPVVKEERPAELPVVSAPLPAPAPVEGVAVEKTEDLQPDPRDLEIARLKEEIMALKAELEKADQEKVEQVPASTTVSATEKLRAKTEVFVLGLIAATLGLVLLFAVSFLSIMWRKDYNRLVERQREITRLECELDEVRKAQKRNDSRSLALADGQNMKLSAEVQRLKGLLDKCKKQLTHFCYLWIIPGYKPQEIFIPWAKGSPRNKEYGNVIFPGIGKVPATYLTEVLRRRPDLLTRYGITLPPQNGEFRDFSPNAMTAINQILDGLANQNRQRDVAMAAT
jgi:hypothetical protein